MNTGARISVITVVLNAASHIEATIQSVIDKKKAVDLDYIIIDGGSTDGTIDIKRRYENQLYYWISECDSGIYDAMNKGWAAAADDSYILFLGAGDLLISLPDNMDGYALNEVVYGNVLMGGKTVFTARDGFHLKLYNSLHHQALLINKGFHPDAPFDTSYKIYADFDFNQRLMKSGARFIYSPQFVAYAHPGGLSYKKNFSESLRIIRKNYGCLWMMLALGGAFAMKVFPLLKRLRPFKEV
jgi:glycosyltransferase involved in cell wall biosynthesis